MFRLPSLARFAAALTLTTALFAFERPVHAQATTTTLEPSKDTSLYQDNGGSTANGAGPNLFIGRTNQSSTSSRRRALVEFDFSSIPAGSVITSVSLEITRDMLAPTSSGQTVSMHRVTQEWGESLSLAGGPGGLGAPSVNGDATWIHTFFPSSNWTTAGGDFVATASASGASAAQTTINSTAALVADVQLFVDDDSMNHGWILLGNESVSGSAERYISREGPGVNFRPQLTVTFTAGGTPQALRGDCDDNGALGLPDVIFFLSFLFSAGPAPVCPDACDINDDGSFGLVDAIEELNFLFSGSPVPNGGQCAPDMTADTLPDTCDQGNCPTL